MLSSMAKEQFTSCFQCRLTQDVLFDFPYLYTRYSEFSCDRAFGQKVIASLQKSHQLMTHKFA
jgi:hypothetical protein